MALDLAFSAEFNTFDNLGALLDFYDKEIYLESIIKAGEFILERTAQKENYGFTDRSGRLRASIGVGEREEITRSNIFVSFSAGPAINPKDGYDYSNIIEFGYGGQYSYLRKAFEEGRGIFATLVANEIRDQVNTKQQDIYKIIVRQRKKNIFYRDSKGRFAPYKHLARG